MVQKPDIQYVTQFYSYGSEAKVLELKPVQKKKFTLPKVVPQHKVDLRFLSSKQFMLFHKPEVLRCGLWDYVPVPHQST